MKTGLQEQAVRELVGALVRGRPTETAWTIEALGAHGAIAVDAVAPLLRSEQRETRWRAAATMGRIGAPSVEALLDAARDDNYLIRVPAIWALEHIGDRRSLDTLLENLNGANECCRWMAAAALSRIGGDEGRTVVETAFARDPVGMAIVDELLCETTSPARAAYSLATGTGPVVAQL